MWKEMTVRAAAAGRAYLLRKMVERDDTVHHGTAGHPANKRIDSTASRAVGAVCSFSLHPWSPSSWVDSRNLNQLAWMTRSNKLYHVRILTGRELGMFCSARRKPHTASRNSDDLLFSSLQSAQTMNQRPWKMVCFFPLPLKAIPLKA